MCVLISDEVTTPEWRSSVSRWLVEAGCLYFLALGEGCEDWHDHVDEELLEKHDYKDIPDAEFIMTTWHDDEPLSEVFWFAAHAAHHDIAHFQEVLLLDVTKDQRREEMLKQYRNAAPDLGSSDKNAC
ncbi:MAG: hypothetical protein AAGH41_02190 [Pseudomonadota bacterium]